MTEEYLRSFMFCGFFNYSLWTTCNNSWCGGFTVIVTEVEAGLSGVLLADMFAKFIELEEQVFTAEAWLRFGETAPTLQSGAVAQRAPSLAFGAGPSEKKTAGFVEAGFVKAADFSGTVAA